MKSPKINVLIPARKTGGVRIYWLKISEKLGEFIDSNIIENTHPHSLNPFYFMNLARKCKKCDLLHIQFNYDIFGSLFKKINGFYGWLFFLTVKPHGPKIIATIHDLVDYEKLNIFQRAYLGFLNLPLKIFCDRIIVHSKHSVNQLLKQGFDKNKIVEIAHGVDEVKHISSKDARRKNKITEKKTIVLFGFIRKDKQYEKVIDALPLLENTQLLIIGKSENEKYLNLLKEEIKNKGLENMVIFKENAEDKYSWLSCGDVVVLPYSRISASGVLNDAISAGVPAVTSKLPEFEEYQKLHKTLITCNVNSKHELANSIKRAIGNKELIENMKKYVQKYNRREVAKRTKKLYDEVLNRGK